MSKRETYQSLQGGRVQCDWPAVLSPVEKRKRRVWMIQCLRMKEKVRGKGSYNSHRVRGSCFPFLCRLSPCTRASPWGSSDLSKRLQWFTSTWSGKSRLRCSWYKSRGSWIHVGGVSVKWGQRAVWGGGWFPRKTTNWKDYQRIEWKKLLFLVNNSDVREKNPRL